MDKTKVFLLISSIAILVAFIACIVIYSVDKKSAQLIALIVSGIAFLASTSMTCYYWRATKRVIKENEDTH